MAMATRVEARLATKTIAVRAAVECPPEASTPLPQMPALLSALLARYQRLRVKLVSTSGAHSTFQVWGTYESAIRPATAPALMPAWFNW